MYDIESPMECDIDTEESEDCEFWYMGMCCRNDLYDKCTIKDKLNRRIGGGES